MRLFTSCLLLLLFCCTGCLDILENIVLNKDGSGQYTYTIDMSAILKEPAYKSMLMGENKGEPIKDIDTIIYGKNLSAADKGNQTALWNKVDCHVIQNEKKAIYTITVNMPFDKVEDINYLLLNMNKIINIGSGDNTNTSNDMGNAVVTYKFKKNEINRTTSDLPANVKEGLAMAKMMMGEATYRVIYQLPGKIKKADIPGATTDQKTVKTSSPYADLLDEKKNLDGTIKFK